MTGHILIERVNRLESVVSWHGADAWVSSEYLHQALRWLNEGVIPDFEVVEHDFENGSVRIEKLSARTTSHA